MAPTERGSTRGVAPDRPPVVGWDSPGSRGHPGANRIVSNNGYAHGPLDLPFKPIFCGSCTWQAGHYWQRERCTLFGVELVVRGDVVFTQNGRESLVEPGGIFLLQPGSAHRYQTGPSGFCERRFAGFGGTLIDSFLTRSGLGSYDTLAGPWNAELAGRLQRLEDTMRTRGSRDQTLLSELAYAFLLSLADMVSSPYPTAVRDALAFIRQNLHRSLDNSEIAAAAHVSVPHLARLFRAALRTSPVRCHVTERMARARVMLRYSGRSIKEVAQATGYDDPLYFSKRFHKHAGMSPREYRAGRVLDGRPASP